ncbi:MAG TPA: hypothetical protein VKE27_11410 [Candidatus Dormibacteraeota bacterium]|nr:hypothetical protein [Candidatus Dormibacteraeota bacterium]
MAKGSTSTVMQNPAVAAPPTKQPVSFREATVERVSQMPAMATGVALRGSTGAVYDQTVRGAGYMYGIVLDFLATGGTDTGGVAFEDAPFSILQQVILQDVSGQLILADGFSLWLHNLFAANYRYRYTEAATGTSVAPQDAALTRTSTAGSRLFTALSAAGNTSFQVRAAVGFNRRDLTAILGNQDRAQQYDLNVTIATAAAATQGPIFTTAPSTGAAATYTLTPYYENYAVPLPQSPTGAPQQVLPPSFGTLHYITKSVNATPPNGGSQVNHYISRIGNTVRGYILVFRSGSGGTPRGTADANSPTNLTVKFGDTPQFVESWTYRRYLMFEYYGFEWPAGVIVYPDICDFGPGAGSELGNSYLYTQTISEAQFLVTYPSGFGSTSNSLTVITDDFQRVAPLGQ